MSNPSDRRALSPSFGPTPRIRGEDPPVRKLSATLPTNAPAPCMHALRARAYLCA